MSDEKKGEKIQHIYQQSHGHFSPNIVGNNNTVNTFSVNTGRRLSAGQKAAISAALAPFAGYDAKDLLWTMMGDGECIAFTHDLVEAMRGAGWILPGTGFGQGVYPGYIEGLIVLVHGEDIPKEASALMQCLARMGFSGAIESSDRVQDGAFQLLVGHKS